jgi:hypothetical protein
MYIVLILLSVVVIAAVVFFLLNSGRFGKVEGPTSQGAIDHFDMVVVYEGARADALVVLGTLGSLGFEARLSEELRDSLFLTANVHPIQVKVPREQAEEASAALEQAREDSPGAAEADDSAGD